LTDAALHPQTARATLKGLLPIFRAKLIRHDACYEHIRIVSFGLDPVETTFSYGAVDAMPLFLGLAGAYCDRTGDLDFIRGTWTNIRNALNWMDNYGDRDKDGFVEYARAIRTTSASTSCASMAKLLPVAQQPDVYRAFTTMKSRGGCRSCAIKLRCAITK
jgi:hypothetical protein